jgi:hypothetical protein
MKEKGDKKTDKEDSDVDDLDFKNFKGIYFGDDNVKHTDPKTGAHFEYYDFCKRLSRLKVQRGIIDEELGIVKSQDASKAWEL